MRNKILLLAAVLALLIPTARAQTPYTDAWLNSLNFNTVYPCGNQGNATQQLHDALVNVTKFGGGTIDMTCYQSDTTITTDLFSAIAVPVRFILSEHNLIIAANSTIPAYVTFVYSPGSSISAAPGFSIVNNSTPTRSATGYQQLDLGVTAAPVLTPGAAGTLPLGTYYYCVTSLPSTGGQSQCSAEAHVTLTGVQDSVGLTWPSDGTAATYRIYRGTASGAENVYYTSATNSLADTGAAGTAGSPPAINTAWIAVGAGGGSGTVVSFNGGAAFPSANFSDSTPSASACSQNINWQTSGANASGELVLNLGNNCTVIDASKFAGDWGAKVNAAAAQVCTTYPAGGTVDARGLEGAQTMNEVVDLVSVGCPIKLLFGAMTLTRGSGKNFAYATGDSFVGLGKDVTSIRGNDALATFQAPATAAYNVYWGDFTDQNFNGTITHGVTLDWSNTIASKAETLALLTSRGIVLGGPLNQIAANPNGPAYYNEISDIDRGTGTVNSYALDFEGTANSNTVYGGKYDSYQTPAIHFSIGSFGNTIIHPDCELVPLCVDDWGQGNSVHDWYVEANGATYGNAWTLNTAYTPGMMITDANGTNELCIQRGTSGGSVPGWPAHFYANGGIYTLDGSTIWESIDVGDVVWQPSAHGATITGGGAANPQVGDYTFNRLQASMATSSVNLHSVSQASGAAGQMVFPDVQAGNINVSRGQTIRGGLTIAQMTLSNTPTAAPITVAGATTHTYYAVCNLVNDFDLSKTQTLPSSSFSATGVAQVLLGTAYAASPFTGPGVVAGTGFAVNDTVQMVAGTAGYGQGNGDTVLKVTATDGFGHVTGLSVVTPGTGLSQVWDWATTTLTGTGTGLFVNATGYYNIITFPRFASATNLYPTSSCQWDVLKDDTAHSIITSTYADGAAAPYNAGFSPQGAFSDVLWDWGQTITAGYSTPTRTNTGDESVVGHLSAGHVIDTSLTPGNCVQATTGGQLSTTAGACGGGGGSMVYPGAGVPNSTGSAWGTSYAVGGANGLVQLNSSGYLPALNASLLTGWPTFNQSTTGNAATATVLASAPTQCSSAYATGIAANGNANCTPTGQIGARAVSGATDTIVAGDAGGVVAYNGAVSVTVTLPTATTLGISRIGFTLINATTGTNTTVVVNATTWSIYPNDGSAGASSFTCAQGQYCFFYVSSQGGAWAVESHEPQISASANISIARAAAGITIAFSGPAPTATALAGTPTQCTGSNFSTGVAASGNSNCAALPVSYHTCEVVVTGTGTASALQAGDDAPANNSCYNKRGSTGTITAVYCKNDHASNSVTINPTFGAAGTGTTILSTPLTCGSSETYSATGTVSNASLTDGSGIDIGMGGTLVGTNLHVVIVYSFPAGVL